MGGGFPLHRNLIVDLFRFYNPGNGDHFYTANKAEIPAGYISEGVACKVYLNDKEKLQWHLKGNDPIDVGLVPLFRYYNPGNGDHFYTANKAEIPAGYISEGIACYAYKSLPPLE